MKEYNDNLVQPPTVVLFHGKYICVDGQTTIAVLKTRNGGKDLLVECKVFDDQSITEEDIGELFVLQRGYTTPVQKKDKLRVLYNIGDPDTVSFVECTENLGLKINWSGGGGTKGKTVAVNTLFSVYDSSTRSQYEMIIRVLLQSWGGSPDSLTGNMFKGMHLFIKTYDGDFKESDLINRLSKVPPQEIIREAKMDRNPGARRYAIEILNVYNKGRRNKLPNKFN